MTWMSALQSLARYTTGAVAKVVGTLIPGAKPVLEVIEQIRDVYARQREKAEKGEILKALQITEGKLNAFDRMFILLGRDCLNLLERVDALETAGRDSTDEITREVLRRPELQGHFDEIGREFARLERRVDGLEADVRRLDEQYASLGAFAAETKEKPLSDTELADFREFRRAKQFQSAGNYAESEPILLKLANSQPASAAVAVALAVARHDDPAGFDTQLKRAQRLRPDDANLRALASAATVAVTGRRTPMVNTPRPTPPTDRAPQVGDTLDGYHLLAALGGGGWGRVFHSTEDGRDVAVKVMRGELAKDPSFRRAFNRESVSLIRMPRHGNIVAVESNGFCQDFQCPYFVMPLLDGLNLEQHLDRHGVPTAEAAMGWLLGLLDALEHAHGHGLIHRDLKPQNIMVLPDGRVVLIDFGIAGLADVAGYTQAIGKSSFFAPPELHGLGQADVRSDLFMLAATLFYALRYDQPMTGPERSCSSGLAAVFYALRYDQPMTERAYFQYEAALVPEEFGMAFDAALSQKPGKRPASVLEMRGLLQVNEAELVHIRREREIAERKQREQLEQARREAERERLKKEAEEAERRRREAEEKEKARLAELCRQNFARWQETDAPLRWVEGRLPTWDHASWAQLLRDLEQNGRFWPMAEGEIGKHLEGIRERLNEERRNQEQERKRVAEEERRKREEEARRKQPKVPEQAAGEQMEIVVGTIRRGGFLGFGRRDEPVKMRFAWCPPGTFLMGSPESETNRGSDERQHEVRLTRGFFAGVHPVTQAQYQAVMGSNPSHFKGDTLPVESVSWEDTVKFRATLKQKSGVDLRLPTEAEWEYAARGGTATPFYWGTELNGTQANCDGNYPYGTDTKGPYLQTTPVGSYAAKYPHPWGLTDVIGNVWEWCSDWYDSGYYAKSPKEDPTGPESGSYRVFWGGCWDNNAGYCRAAIRSRDSPDIRISFLGFRVALVPSGPSGQ